MARKKSDLVDIKLSLPKAVVAAIDEVAGNGERVAFIQEAIEDKLKSLESISGAMGRSSG